MRAIVDADACTGCGLCTDICPEVFELEGDVAVVRADPVPAGMEDSAQEATDSCPVDAIRIEG